MSSSGPSSEESLAGRRYSQSLLETSLIDYTWGQILFAASNLCKWLLPILYQGIIWPWRNHSSVADTVCCGLPWTIPHCLGAPLTLRRRFPSVKEGRRLEGERTHSFHGYLVNNYSLGCDKTLCCFSFYERIKVNLFQEPPKHCFVGCVATYRKYWIYWT